MDIIFDDVTSQTLCELEKTQKEFLEKLVF